MVCSSQYLSKKAASEGTRPGSNAHNVRRRSRVSPDRQARSPAATTSFFLHFSLGGRFYGRSVLQRAAGTVDEAAPVEIGDEDVCVVCDETEET